MTVFIFVRGDLRGVRKRRRGRNTLVCAHDFLCSHLNMVAEPCSNQGNDRMVDVRMIQKPEVFNGEATQWSDWSFKMRAYMTVMDPDMSDMMKMAQVHSEVIEFMRMSKQNKRLANKIHYILVMSISGVALAIAKGVEDENGAELWRKLWRKYEPTVGAQQVGLLQRIMSPKFAHDKIEAAIQEWEHDIRRYEESTGDMVSDAMKVTIITNNCPREDLKMMIMMRSGANYEEVKGVISCFLQNSQSKIEHQIYGKGPTPMEVDNVSREHVREMVWREGDYDIGAFGKKSSHKGKGEWIGKGYQYGSFKGKGARKDNSMYAKGKGSTWMGKGPKGGCYKCGGDHYARECTVGGRSIGVVEEQGDMISGFEVSSTEKREVPVEMITIDSGAAVSVMPAKWYPRDITDSNVTYRAANGGEIKDRGQRKIQFVTRGGSNANMEFRLADVLKPLASVGWICAKGNRVVFDDVDGSYVESKREGWRIPLRKSKGVYVMDAQMLKGSVPCVGDEENDDDLADFTRQGRMEW